MKKQEEERKMMLKKMTGLLLALVMCLTLCIPAFAVDAEQGQMGTIGIDEEERRNNELISLAAQMARSGNYELANAIESKIRDLGVDVLTTAEARQYISEISGEKPNLDDVTPPPNDNSVHWYRTVKTNYAYGSSKYDIIRIKAVSWDDTNDWLHIDNKFVKNTSHKNGALSLTKELIKAWVGESAILKAQAVLLTVSDILQAVSKEATEYSALDIPKDAITCYWSADLTVVFNWIRKHGDSDYILRVKECQIAVDYAYLMTVKFVRADGRVDTYPDVGGSFGTRYYSDANYLDWDRVCSAYLKGKIMEYTGGSLHFEINGETTTIPHPTLPPYMESI